MNNLSGPILGLYAEEAHKRRSRFFAGIYDTLSPVSVSTMMRHYQARAAAVPGQVLIGEAATRIHCELLGMPLGKKAEEMATYMLGVYEAILLFDDMTDENGTVDGLAYGLAAQELTAWSVGGICTALAPSKPLRDISNAFALMANANVREVRDHGNWMVTPYSSCDIVRLGEKVGVMPLLAKLLTVAGGFGLDPEFHAALARMWTSFQLLDDITDSHHDARYGNMTSLLTDAILTLNARGSKLFCREDPRETIPGISQLNPRQLLALLIATGSLRRTLTVADGFLCEGLAHHRLVPQRDTTAYRYFSALRDEIGQWLSWEAAYHVNALAGADLAKIHLPSDLDAFCDADALNLMPAMAVHT